MKKQSNADKKINSEEKDVSNKSLDFQESVKNVKSFMTEQDTFIPPVRDVIALSDDETLNFSSLNYKSVIFEKDIDILKLKISLIEKDKEEMINSYLNSKNRLGVKHQVNIDDYFIDLPNKRLVHKRLLQNK